jgi:aerobic carbon-monoxide dehydrogenase medium subunit
MGSTPLRATATEQALANGADPAQAAQYAAEGTSPAADIHADAEYRRHLARVLTERALSGQRS